MSAEADTADLHSTYQADGTWWEATEERLYWSGTFWVFSFNDAGEGFGHQLAWNCPATGMVADGVASFKGFCVKTDSDGDKLFSTWVAEAPVDEPFAGRETYNGGTGKYDGLVEEHDFICHAVGPNEAGILPTAGDVYIALTPANPETTQSGESGLPCIGCSVDNGAKR